MIGSNWLTYGLQSAMQSCVLKKKNPPNPSTIGPSPLALAVPIPQHQRPFSPLLVIIVHQFPKDIIPRRIVVTMVGGVHVHPSLSISPILPQTFARMTNTSLV
jgi:hypothetical protein